jgi:DNA-binding transcriptional ArsR family regulator
MPIPPMRGYSPVSNTALTWAFNVPIKGAPKGVLVALADCMSDATKRCDPSNARLALYAGVDERTVRRALRSLADGGLITVTEREGRRSQFTLAITAPDVTPPRYIDEPRTLCPPITLATPDTTSDHPGHYALPTPDTVSKTPDTTPPYPLEPSIKPKENP